MRATQPPGHGRRPPRDAMVDSPATPRQPSSPSRTPAAHDARRPDRDIRLPDLQHAHRQATTSPTTVTAARAVRCSPGTAGSSRPFPTRCARARIVADSITESRVARERAGRQDMAATRSRTRLPAGSVGTGIMRAAPAAIARERHADRCAIICLGRVDFEQPRRPIPMHIVTRPICRHAPSSWTVSSAWNRCQRLPERNRAAIDVDLVGIHAEIMITATTCAANASLNSISFTSVSDMPARQAPSAPP